MARPVQLYLLALILNLWLVFATVGQVLDRGVPTEPTERRSGQEASEAPAVTTSTEATTWGLFRLSKVDPRKTERWIQWHKNAFCTQTNSAQAMSSCYRQTENCTTVKCCQMSLNETCRFQCSIELSEMKPFEVRMKTLISLEGKCGQPYTVPGNDLFWDCLLQSNYFSVGEQPTNLKQIDTNKVREVKYEAIQPGEAMNPAKWLCCERSHSEICRQLCYRTLGNEWLESWQKLDQICLNSVDEEPLRLCLADADNVCSFGCKSTLKFCHYFNNLNGRRGTVNFYRKCNIEADQAARHTYQSWMQREVLQYSRRLGLHFRNLTNCQPEMWKLLACTLHLRPCLPERHQTEICRSNCKELVDGCIDLKQTSRQFDSSVLCDILTNKLGDLSTTSSSRRAELPPESGVPSCIDIKQYQLGALSTSGEQETMYNPCKTSKCRVNQMCLRNQDCSWASCPVNRCVNVCTIGKLGELKVPEDTFVTLPLLDAQNVTIEIEGELDRCLNLCYCNRDGRMGECQFYCVNRGKGEIVRSTEKAAYEQLECMTKCSPEYDPICNYETSQTYFNACFRDCVLKRRRSRSENSINSFEMNNCGKVIDPRKEAKIICPPESESREKCTIDTRTQLLPLNSDSIAGHREKNQFHVIIRKMDNLRYRDDIQKLSNEDDETVCDNQGIEHANLRAFHLASQANLSFSYFGNCLIYCSLFGPVCGRDGVDYQSECAAMASNNLLVDYFSSCGSSPVICPDLKCPSRQFVHYLPLNWCPFCGSVAYFYYESDYFDYITSQVDEHSIKQSLLHRHKLTVQALSQQLRDLITVNVCDFYMHLVSESFLVALMKPKFNANQQVALHQHQICTLELDRLVTLVKNQAPVIQLHFPLSLLRYNETIALKVANLPVQGTNAAGLAAHWSFHCTVACVLLQKFSLSLIKLKLI